MRGLLEAVDVGRADKINRITRRLFVGRHHAVRGIAVLVTVVVVVITRQLLVLVGKGNLGTLVNLESFPTWYEAER